MRTLRLTPLPTDKPGGYLGSLVADGDRVWAAGGTYHKPTLYFSQDRGHSFTSWQTPAGMPGLRDVHVDGDLVWVVGEWGGIARTSDGGATWKPIRIRQPAHAPMVIQAPSPTSAASCLYSIMRGVDRRLWILGDNGLLLRGRTPKANVVTFDEVANVSTDRLLYMFVDGTTTWILDSGGMLQRDAGRGFEQVPLKAMRTPRPLCALARTPKRTLLLLGDGGLILRSTNDGASWKKISIDSRHNLEKLIVTRYGIFVVGGAGSLLVSHDDGQSFQGLDTTVDTHLWSILEIDGDLLIGGEGGKLWRVDRKELAEVVRAAYAKRDPVLADLAARLRDGDEGAELVLEDALKERELL